MDLKVHETLRQIGADVETFETGEDKPGSSASPPPNPPLLPLLLAALVVQTILTPASRRAGRRHPGPSLAAREVLPGTETPITPHRQRRR